MEFGGRYRQYSFDLLRLCIYIRKLVANDSTKQYLEDNAPDALARFQRILIETPGVEESTPQS